MKLVMYIERIGFIMRFNIVKSEIRNATKILKKRKTDFTYFIEKKFLQAESHLLFTIQTQNAKI